MASPAKTAIKLHLRLRLVATVDFRHGVPFHYDELKKSNRLDEVRADECILLVSQTGTRVAFVFREANTTSRNGEPVKVVSSFQLALDRRTPWSPLMLQNYAEQVGIELLGLKRFEDHVLEGVKP